MVVAGTNPRDPETGSFGAPEASYMVNLPATTEAVAGALSLGYIASRLTLEARLSLGESEGHVKTLASPKVATLDNKEAEIKSGVELPQSVLDPATNRVTVTFREAFLRLKVKPHVTADKRVNMEIEAEHNTPGRTYTTGAGDVISIDKRTAKTEVMAENGGTVVLGGLYVSTEDISERRIPWLGKIPILGWLFKTRTIKTPRNELLIFITPTILEERKA